jgi:uncharacterized membrane protein YhdT
MMQKILWRAVLVTRPISAFFVFYFCGMISPDLRRGSAVFALTICYFFVMGRVAAIKESAQTALDGFDWFQLACFWVATIGVSAPVIVYWLTHSR